MRLPNSGNTIKGFSKGSKVDKDNLNNAFRFETLGITKTLSTNSQRQRRKEHRLLPLFFYTSFLTVSKVW
jgi:hypothetical protein